jgi:hypothetical protein
MKKNRKWNAKDFDARIEHTEKKLDSVMKQYAELEAQRIFGKQVNEKKIKRLKFNIGNYYDRLTRIKEEKEQENYRKWSVNFFGSDYSEI